MKSPISCLLICAASLALGQRLRADPPPAGVPTLDEMAGDWTPATVASNLPDVNNFNQMLIVNRDLTSYFCSPGGLFAGKGWNGTQWRAGYPLVSMALDGVEYQATDFRWFPYRAMRRNLDCAGLAVETDTRMVNEQRGVLCRVTVTNPTKAARTIQLVLKVPGELDGSGPGVVNRVQNPRNTTAVQPSRPPDATTPGDQLVTWTWKLTLPAGGQASVGFVAGDESEANATETRQKVAGWASHFDHEMDAFRATWEKRWADAFTPHNTHFSGSLPILKTDAPALRRNYYMGVLTMLGLERTQFPINRAFITSGERGEGTQYYWDASMNATAWALLEPQGMKAVLRRWLTQNPRGGPHISLRDTNGYDAKTYDAINGYATNACVIFHSTDIYLRITGDRAFLEEKVENGRTVMDTLDAFATDWETLPKTPHGLANYGGNGKLLETAGTYIEGVASVNAQDIWMMRRMAEWQAFKGNDARADELRKKAAAFLPTVLALYNAETGAWNVEHMDGSIVQEQHCVDFIYAGDALANDLSAQQKAGMVGFVKRELLTRDWMRAMSWKSPEAKRSFRPDHSPTGAYDGWVPLTVEAMWRLGATREAYDFYCRAAEVTKEGPFAQAHEFYGPTPASNDAPARIAMNGHNMKECISGGAFADVVLHTFFGLDPSVDGKTLLANSAVPRPFQGRLENVRQGEKSFTIIADQNSLRTATP